MVYSSPARNRAAMRDLAIFNLAIDSKLHARDLVKLRLDDICSAARFGVLVKKGATARVHRVDFGRLRSRVLVPSGDDLTDSLESRHEGRAFIQHGQNLVSGLGRKH